jgi:magnesium chelatase family protein
LAWPDLPEAADCGPAPPAPDLAEVRGQAFGRQALEVAAAGGHHLLMVGPAGAGKTMLATRLPGLLPPLSADDALEVAKVHSAAGLEVGVTGLSLRPPFRAPHHSASAVSLVGGGGARIRPGEVSCAHHGVLFMDELAEFPGSVLDNLRQPLEEGRIVVCRASATVSFPARFMLVAAMNACRCGADGSPGSCRCPATARARYVGRISGPLLDRFDLRVRVRRPDVDDLLGRDRGAASGPGHEPTGVVAQRVARARELSRQRGARCNAELPAPELDRFGPLSAGAKRLLERRLRDGRLSARGLQRVRRVALTLADLAGCDGKLDEEHLLMALALRAPGVLGPEDECAGGGVAGPTTDAGLARGLVGR